MIMPAKLGKHGEVVIPAGMRRRMGLEAGTLVVAEEREGGVLIRPAVALPLEVYTPRRKAEFLLNNAVDASDYKRARRAVERMGLDPDTVPHPKPRKR